MNEQQQTLDTLRDIKSIMDRSSRFISLSGWSGVAAGLCALIGAWMAHGVIEGARGAQGSLKKEYLRGATSNILLGDYISSKLLLIAAFTFMAAVVSAFFFTWLRSRKTGMAIFGAVSRRLTVAMAVPMLAGAIYLFQLMQAGAFGFIAPGCLLFYGLALINASRYTPGEIKYLGYGQLLLGIINLYSVGYGLYFWAAGFGILHIVYGIIMWLKYEKE